jgi:hypothetical protein
MLRQYKSVIEAVQHRLDSTSTGSTSANSSRQYISKQQKAVNCQEGVAASCHYATA